MRALGRLGLFHRFLLSYCLLLVLPLALGWIAYGRAITALRDSEIRATVFHLHQTVASLDESLAGVESLVGQMWQDPIIHVFGVFNGRDQNPLFNYDLYHVLEDLSRYRAADQFVDGIYLSYSKSRVLLSGDKDFHSLLLDGYGADSSGMTRDSALGMFATLPKPGFSLASFPPGLPGAEPGIIYVSRYPDSPLVSPLISAVVVVEGKSLREVLGAVSPAGFSALVAADGTILVSSSGKTGGRISAVPAGRNEGYFRFRSGGGAMLAAYTTSSALGLKVVSASPEWLVVGRTRLLLLSMIGMSLLITFLGLLAAVVLSRRNTRPVLAIAQAITGKQIPLAAAGRDEYESITRSVKEIVDRNRELARTLEEQIPALRSAFFERLLSSRYPTEETAIAVARGLGVDITGKLHCVVAAAPATADPASWVTPVVDLVRWKAVAQETIRAWTGQVRVVLTDNPERHLVLLLSSPSADPALLREEAGRLCRELAQRIADECGDTALFAAGRPRSAVTRIASSAREATMTLDAGPDRRGFALRWYEPSDSGDQDYPYSLGFQELLSNTVRAGARKDVEAVLDRWYRSQVEPLPHAPHLPGLLSGDFRSTSYRLLGQITAVDAEERALLLERIDELGKSAGIPESFGLFRGILSGLTRAVERERHDRRLSLAAEMQQYVRAHMANLALNRYLVATEFGMNETYFSEFFHRQTGDTFSDYLERSRIDKALDLMTGGDSTIVDIAREVGYSNDKVFRRAFKRVMGVSPGSYRDMNAPSRVSSAASR